MKISEFWTLLKISEEQSKYFDENMGKLTDNQKSLLKKTIESDIIEYKKTFNNVEDGMASTQKEAFANLHFSSINKWIIRFSERTNNLNQNAPEWKQNSDREYIDIKNKIFQDKIKNMELKVKVVCRHCQTAGGVYIAEGKDVIKTRVNSLPARLIGLGVNTDKNFIKFMCINCDMEWKTEN